RPTLAAPVGMLQDVLPRLFAHGGHEHPPALAAEMTTANLTDGIPLLRGETLSLDMPAFRRRWHAVCAAVQRHQNPDGGKALADGMERGTLEPAPMLASVLAGKPEEIHHHADALGLDAGLTTAILGLVLLPALSQINAALGALRLGVSWQYGYCPTCGS